MAPNQEWRSLTESERTEVWKRLQERWSVENTYWYPLRDTEMAANVIAFEAEWFFSQISLEMLQGILRIREITRIWELREGGAVYEMDYQLLDPVYDGEEGYWTSQDMDWLLYVSHESSLTVAGDWFISAIQALWPQWHHHLWHAYDYERPAGKTSHF